MSEFLRVTARTMVAKQDMRTKQYRILRASAANECQVASFAAGGPDEIIGVLQNKPNNNEHAAVGFAGVSKVIAGAAVTANRMVTTDGSGQAIHASSGDWLLGMAVTAAGAASETISVLISMPAQQAPSSLAAT